MPVHHWANIHSSLTFNVTLRLHTKKGMESIPLFLLQLKNILSDFKVSLRNTYCFFDPTERETFKCAQPFLLKLYFSMGWFLVSSSATVKYKMPYLSENGSLLDHSFFLAFIWTLFTFKFHVSTFGDC